MKISHRNGLPKFKVAVSELDHQRLMALINSMTDAVLAVGEDGKVLISNSAALNLLDANNLSGRSIDDVLKLVDNRGHRNHITEHLEGKRKDFISRDLRLKYDDGSFVNVYISAAPVYGGFGRGSGGHVVLLRDITDEKSLEEERSEFISVASHELRTPIAIAEGNLSNALFLAQKTKASDSIIKGLADAHEQVMFLSSLINDLSMLSKAERGKLGITIEKVNLPELVEETAANFQNQARDKGLELKLEMSSAVKPIASSRLYIQEILQNFITNAIKYTDAGSIKLIVRPSGDSVEVGVQDTGIGIGKHDQDKLFSKFFRSEDWRVRKVTGTGLGLYVSLKLAAQIGAQLHLQSELDHGSTFSLLLPLNLEPKKSKA